MVWSLSWLKRSGAQFACAVRRWLPVVSLGGRLRQAIDACDDVVLLFRADGACRFVSQASRAVLGYEPEELAHVAVPHLLPDCDPAARLRDALADGQARCGRGCPVRHRDGSPRWIDLDVRALPDGGTLVRMRDVTEARRAQSLARAAERRYRALIGGIAEHGLYTLSAEGVIETVSAGARPFGGAVGAPVADLFSAEEQAAGEPARALAQAAAGGRYQAEGWRHRPDGTRYRALAAINAVRDVDGSLLGFVKIIRDVTRHHVGERALRDSEERLRLMIDGIDDHAMYMLDCAGVVRSWNRGAQRIKGYQAGEILGQHFGRFYTAPDNEAGEPAKALAAARASGRYEAEGWRLRKDGTRFWAGVVITPLHDSVGTLLGFMKVTRDLSERSAEAERRRLIIEAAPDGMVLVDERGLITFSNSRAETIFGYPPGALVGLPVEALVPENRRLLIGPLRLANDAVPVTQDGQAVSKRELIGRRRDGTSFPVEVGINAIRTPRGRIVVASIVDMSGQKAAAAALQQAKGEASRLQGLLTDALDVMDEGIALYDADDRLMVTNRAMKEMMPGQEPQFTLGSRFEEILVAAKQAYDGRADDEEFQDFVARRLDQFMRGDGSATEQALPDGRWMLLRDFRTRDGGTISVATDITPLKRALEAEEAARERSDAANRAKSAFLAAMSHEIRTPMNGVIGFADLLLDSRLSDEQRQHATLLRECGQSLLGIINDILDLSKIEADRLELEQVPIKLPALLEQALAVVRSAAAEKGIALSAEVAADVPDIVLGDPTRLRQVLMNLLGNAAKFTERGSISLRVRRDPAPGRLRFEVEDTGIGIPADRHHLLFQDFSQIDRSMARRYGGTGLGLSISRKLAQAMGGAIGVESRAGAGSLFWFTVALVEPSLPRLVPAPSAKPVPVGKARVLVAEDVRFNQIIVEKMLRAAGHEVTMVGNGADALRALQSGEHDLVLMDMEMPGMGGVAATQAIRKLGPRLRSIPIVALTANAMLEDAAACRAAGMNDFLPKPISREALIAMIDKWSIRRRPAA